MFETLGAAPDHQASSGRQVRRSVDKGATVDKPATL
jgi:hypothetical protein